MTKKNVQPTRLMDCDCGEKIEYSRGQKIRLNRAGAADINFRRHWNDLAEVIGFYKDGRCLTVAWDGNITPDIVAVAFFHESVGHNAWTLQSSQGKL